MAHAADSGQIKIGHFNVNRLGYGAMRITGDGVWGPPADPEVAKTVLKRAVELGVNFIDTADAYGPHVSEQLIHDALFPYEGLVIATKGGLTRQGPGIWTPDGSPAHLREALDASLSRLGVDCIDLYQLHAVDAKVPMEESLRALVELQKEGKIKDIGLSNVSLEQLKAARKLADIVSVQNMYNFASTDSEDVLQYCAEEGLAFIPYFPIGGDGQTDMSALQEVATKHDASVHQVALAWLLAHSPATLPIPGTGSVAHLEDNVAAGAIKLDQDDLDRLEA